MIQVWRTLPLDLKAEHAIPVKTDLGSVERIQSASFQLGCRNQKAALAVSPPKQRGKEKRVGASPCVLMPC